jgi:hypothetical protein
MLDLLKSHLKMEMLNSCKDGKLIKILSIVLLLSPNLTCLPVVVSIAMSSCGDGTRILSIMKKKRRGNQATEKLAL